MDSAKVGTVETLKGRKANASHPPKQGEATLPKNASPWLVEAVQKAQQTSKGKATVVLPATATLRDIGYFLRCASRAGLEVCKEGGKIVISCVEEGGKLFASVRKSEKIGSTETHRALLPDGAWEIASAL